MKTNFLVITFVATIVILSSCGKLEAIRDSQSNKSVSIQKKINEINAKPWKASVEAAYKQQMSAFASFKDTNKMDAKKIDASVNYIVTYGPSDKILLQNQKNFVKSSGFPVVGLPMSAKEMAEAKVNDGKFNNVTEMYLNSMHESFDEADSRYKRFIKENQTNRYLSIFKQDAANFIIRKYLLNNVDKKNELKGYFYDLVTNGSNDYPLIYLCLNALNRDMSITELNNYKDLINKDKSAQVFRKSLKIMHTELLNKANSLGGNVGRSYMLQAALIEIPLARSTFFMNKINKLKYQPVM